MERLVIRLPEGAAPVQWAVFDDDGRVVSPVQHGPLEEAAVEAPGRRVTVLVPAVEVVTTEAQLPKSSPAKLRRMLPFALEDALAEDVDDLLFAAGPRLESGAVAAAVTAREKVENWLERLSTAGLSPDSVYSEADGVPDTPSTLTLVIEDERVYGRAPNRPPFVFEGLSLEQILAVVDPDGELKHSVVYVDEAGRSLFGEDLQALGQRIESTQVKLMGDGALFRLGSTLSTQPGTNLLQGPYAPKSDWIALARPWRVAAALLVGLVLVNVVGQGAEYATLRLQDRELTAVLTESCQRELSASLSACESAVRARLSQSGLLVDGGGNYLALMNAVADALPPDSRLQSSDYLNGELTIQIILSSPAALEALERKIERNGEFRFTTQRTSPVENGGIDVRAQIAGADL